MTEPAPPAPTPSPAPAAKPRPSWRTAALRWTLVGGIAFAGAYFARNAILGYEARAATRLVLLDYARFEGCLVGAPPPPESEVPDRVLALALGSGDPIWPHTCANALGRVAREAAEVADNDAQARPLADAARGMENALGAAEFWVDRVQHGSREAPAWVGAYIALRRAVRAHAARKGVALPPAEAPARRRIPRVGGDPPPVPAPMALPGGEEADIVDATATPGEFAVLLRNRRSVYSLCRVVLPIQLAADQRITSQLGCSVLVVPRFADPRSAGFVPSERGAYVALWSRAPASLRGLVDVATREVVMTSAGQPDATRDYWVGPRAAMAVQLTGEGASVLVAHGVGDGRPVPLPATADVVTQERALLGTPTGAAAVWLDARNRHRAELHAVPLGLDADPPRAATTVAVWAEPRLTGVARRIVPCAVPGGPAYVLAGDAVGAELFATRDGAVLTRGATLPRGIDRFTQLACDARGVTVFRREAGVVAPYDCDAARCNALAAVPFEQVASVARTGGDVLVADAGGPEGVARVRRVAPDGRVVDAALQGRVPRARAVAVVARDATVALFVAATETYALISLDAGATFAPVMTVAR